MSAGCWSTASRRRTASAEPDDGKSRATAIDRVVKEIQRPDRGHTLADLAQAHGSVAEVAYHWGFTNLGRFARACRDRFGEFPPRPSTGDRPPALPAEPKAANPLP